MSRASSPENTGQSRKRPQPKASESDFSSPAGLIILSGSPGAATLRFTAPSLGTHLVVLDDREYVTANPHVHAPGLSTISGIHVNWAANCIADLAVACSRLSNLWAEPAGHHFDRF